MFASPVNKPNAKVVSRRAIEPLSVNAPRAGGAPLLRHPFRPFAAGQAPLSRLEDLAKNKTEDSQTDEDVSEREETGKQANAESWNFSNVPPSPPDGQNNRHARFTSIPWKFPRCMQMPLAVVPTDDPSEREAERVAQAVMSGGFARFATSLPVTNVSRKCKECTEDEDELRRRPEAGARNATGAPMVPPVVGDVLNTEGRLLDASERAFFEPRFGHDFGAVRIHCDEQAAVSARAVSALAYTVGSHIVFDSGRYPPYKPAHRHLLAHELTHVVQQRAAPECIQRFGAEEHVKIGDTVEPGQAISLGPDVGSATYGEMIALGDYFESVAEIKQEANDPIFGAQEVLVALWKVNPSARTRPLVGQNVEDAVMARYYKLAAKNQTHFSKASEPGKSNREQFIAMHQTAISNAYSQGSSGVINNVSWEGWEGFAEHFLTDAFSAGHVRTPRHEIQDYWNSKYPKFTDNLVNMICCYMASYLNDRDSVGWVTTVPGLANEIKPILLDNAGPGLGSFAFGDLISVALHDSDSRGLTVRSPAGPGSGPGPYVWRDLGDGYLYKTSADSAVKAAQAQTQKMVEEAVRRSFAEAQAAYLAGEKRAGSLDSLLNPANFKALELIPEEDVSVGNPVYDWKASDIASLNADLQRMVLAEFQPGSEIGDKLLGMKVECITHKSVFDLHTWEAWICFRDMQLYRDTIGTLDRAAKGDVCPPANNNPCGLVTKPCP